MTPSSPNFLRRAGLPGLAYHMLEGRTPAAVFLGGFMSDMTGTKATALEDHCRVAGRGFLRFDYRGHGQSEGAFIDGTVSAWKADALAMIDEAIEGPLVLIGSSMGGWIALLAALARPDRVKGLVGIAAAPDFTEDLLWASYPQSIRRQIMDDGLYLAPSDYGAPYPITRRLIEDGRGHLLLRQRIPLSCPVRLIQGMKDTDVPYDTALKLLERLDSRDATLTLVKEGDHRLSEPDDIARLCAVLEELCLRVA